MHEAHVERVEDGLRLAHLGAAGAHGGISKLGVLADSNWAALGLPTGQLGALTCFCQALFADAGIVTLIDAPRTGIRLPLDLRGTAFQQRVWQALLAIPPGHTASYTEIAARIGAPRASRAVAGACAANHLAVAVPCHRVLRQDGALSGYRWGIARKRALLAQERGEEES